MFLELHSTKATTSSPINPFLKLSILTSNLTVFHSCKMDISDDSPSLAKYRLAVSTIPASTTYPMVLSPMWMPTFPLDGYQLKPINCTYVPTHQQQLHLKSLWLWQVHTWLRKQQDASVQHLCGSHLGRRENLPERIIRRTRQMALMRRGLVL